MFVLYAPVGFAAGFLYARIPKRIVSHETVNAALGPSRAIVLRLAALFSLDAFAEASWSSRCSPLVFEFRSIARTAGVFSSGRACCRRWSFPVAAWLSRRIGLINTMVPPTVKRCPDAGDVRTEHCRWRWPLLLLRAALSQMTCRLARPMSWPSSRSRSGRRPRASHPCHAVSPPRRAQPLRARCLQHPTGLGRSSSVLTLKIVYDLLLLMQFDTLGRRRKAESSAVGALLPFSACSSHT